MTEDERRKYLDMDARIFVRALRDPNQDQEYELSEGHATSLLRERESALRPSAGAGEIEALREENKRLLEIIREQPTSLREAREFADQPPRGPWVRAEIDELWAAAKSETDSIKKRGLRLAIAHLPTQEDHDWAMSMADKSLEELRAQALKANGKIS